MSHSQEMKQLKNIAPEEVQTLNLWDKIFKFDILNMFRKLKETMSKEMREIMRMKFHQIENINKKVEF